MAVVIGASSVIVSPSMAVMMRSQRMSREPGRQPTPNASAPIALIHSAVLGRVTMMRSPTCNALSRCESQIAWHRRARSRRRLAIGSPRELGDRCRRRMRMSVRRSDPVATSVVPPSAAPAPRSTTPDAVIRSCTGNLELAGRKFHRTAKAIVARAAACDFVDRGLNARGVVAVGGRDAIRRPAHRECRDRRRRSRSSRSRECDCRVRPSRRRACRRRLAARRVFRRGRAANPTTNVAAIAEQGPTASDENIRIVDLLKSALCASFQHSWKPRDFLCAQAWMVRRACLKSAVIRWLTRSARPGDDEIRVGSGPESTRRRCSTCVCYFERRFSPLFLDSRLPHSRSARAAATADEEAAYTRTITERADKIVAPLGTRRCGQGHAGARLDRASVPRFDATFTRRATRRSPK